MKTKFLVFLILLSFCAQDTNNVIEDTNNVIDDTNNVIDDTIEPYCNGASYSEVSNLTFSDLKILNISILQSADWYKNLASAYYRSGNYPYGFIEDKYKKLFCIYNSRF